MGERPHAQVFHQLNWFLPGFHEVVASEHFLSELAKLKDRHKFTVHVVFQHDSPVYRWAAAWYKSYPFELRWPKVFKQVIVKIHFSARGVSALAKQHQLRKPIAIVRFSQDHNGNGMLRHLEWNPSDNPYMRWLDEWVRN